MRAVFTKAGYVSGQQVSVKFRVHNSGTSDAAGIRALDDPGRSGLVLDDKGFGRLGRGVTIPAGRSVTVTVSGNLRDLTASKVTFDGDVFDRHGDGVAHFSSSAPVTIRTAMVRGEVFGDADANGRAGAGEGLGHAKVHLGYLYGNKTYSATTGPGGRFRLRVPTATYYLDGRAGRWFVIPHRTTVRADGAGLSLRAVHPLGKVLKASMQFTKGRYRPGDRAHVDVRLKNTGSAKLRGITAACDRGGFPGELKGKGRSWGALAEQGRGVTIPAHSTRTFHVTSTVPAVAQRAGQVVVACDFGYPVVERGYRPTASDSAKVPGQSGALAGTVGHDVRGHSGRTVGLKHVRVILVDPTRCPVFTRAATTDKNGHFRIGHVPAGSSYLLYVHPPKGWKMRGENPTPVQVFGKDTGRVYIQVKHGSAQEPTVPKKCS